MKSEPSQPALRERHFVEWRARSISDPIDRLRYLQRIAHGGPLIRLRIFSVQRCVTALLLLLAFLSMKMQTVSDASEELHPARDVPVRVETPSTPPVPVEVWKIEEARDHEDYSNGLRVENRYRAPTHPRAYYAYSPDRPDQPASSICSEPAGILFHTSESQQAPFEGAYNKALKRIGRGLLEHTRNNQSYHFVIDRFGRVFRIVPEADVAFHAGSSVWADQRGAYVDLNESFLGVSFEAETRANDDGCYLSQGQIHSGRLLVQMLLAKYRIPISNCVTHSQVSVNPRTKRIGTHTDGSGNFPFLELGLTDNYAQPLPSVCVFGFDYDPYFLKQTGSRMWRGLFLAEERVRQEAAAHQLSIRQYKRNLQEKYLTITAALKSEVAPEEKEQ